MKSVIWAVLLAFPCLAQNPISAPSLFYQSIFATVAASTTDYITFSATGFNTTEVTRQIPLPVACIVSNLTVATSGTQSSTGALTITIRKNATATPLSVTIAPGSTPGIVLNRNTVSFAMGDLLGIQLSNTATAASLTVVGLSASCTN